MDIAGFLTARYAETEAVARAAIEKAAGAGVYGEQDRTGRWRATTDGLYADTSYGNGPFAVGTYEYLDEEIGAHITAHDPARVLADLAVKRSVIEDYLVISANAAVERAAGHDVEAAAYELAAKCLLMVLRRFAQADAQHPDFDPAWRIDG